ncbi:MAG TPA: hypothetical protein VLA49_17850 [Anaerolineales bacterium]|nr:hypothetical protein [Anaerolineales bacterium]
MKKTIWIPLVLGIALGLLDFVSLAVHFVLPTSEETFVGPQEIFVTISAALGGPLGLLLTSFFQELGVHFYLLKGQLPPEQVPLEIFVSIADFSAHILATLAVVYCYRLLYQRAKKAITFYLGWILIVIIYYTLLLPLQSFLYNLVIPDMLPLFVWIQSSIPEVLTVVIISPIVWFALPVRYRRPLWIEAQPVPPPAEAKA